MTPLLLPPNPKTGDRRALPCLSGAAKNNERWQLITSVALMVLQWQYKNPDLPFIPMAQLAGVTSYQPQRNTAGVAIKEIAATDDWICSAGLSLEAPTFITLRK